ncbi:hypothetical protein, unlikely [Trypanosoma brucei gambiense DAL972]|uniref:Uncharacterized protein n=1 Tax=Trypanosoma brucei gambiense (strain MHOM/CI/86/DAL972) TaxID=679716 RepID=C9ZV86_TRYB9|nr:hypothetical protein, unlikely [Trypanosoma brucei gambiense DAL972]CBH13324.1 hypothetical protein, unlikely [Trypanosoma brucei gambiense DAL972]|eukprot:XP_011775601.1 hypothetical protein, unlikely [Trypanosoma brucei gambiense DAL972]
MYDPAPLPFDVATVHLFLSSGHVFVLSYLKYRWEKPFIVFFVSAVLLCLCSCFCAFACDCGAGVFSFFLSLQSIHSCAITSFSVDFFLFRGFVFLLFPLPVRMRAWNIHK